jgi:hypothetical protein
VVLALLWAQADQYARNYAECSSEAGLFVGASAFALAVVAVLALNPVLLLHFRVVPGIAVELWKLQRIRRRGGYRDGVFACGC